MSHRVLLAAVVFTTACSSSSETVSAGDTGSDATGDIAVSEVAAEAGPDTMVAEVATDVGDDAPTMGTLFGEPCGESAATTTVFLPGLQYSGSVSWTRTTSSGKERVSVSAPIHPSVDKLYEGEGDFYPKTASLQQSLATHSALTFCFLLGDCKATDSTIKSTAPLSSDDLAHNYDAIASCAYDKYTAKPYWIPQLLLDVDICGTMLGAGWHMPTEDEVASFTASDLDFMSTTLAAKDGNIYFSLSLWVRGKDGTLQIGDLSPSASMHLSPLGVSGDALKYHYEGGVGLRCVKRKPA